MSPPYHCSCLCREIDFEVNAEPIVVSCCHCKNWKKYTGTVFTTNVAFPADNTIRVAGEILVSAFRDTVQDSSNALSRKFCSLCSSTLYDAGCDFGRTHSLFYSASDDVKVVGDDGFAKEAEPQVGYYSKDRTSWVHHVEGTEQPKTKPGSD